MDDPFFAAKKRLLSPDYEAKQWVVQVPTELWYGLLLQGWPASPRAKNRRKRIAHSKDSGFMVGW